MHGVPGTDFQMLTAHPAKKLFKRIQELHIIGAFDCTFPDHHCSPVHVMELIKRNSIPTHILLEFAIPPFGVRRWRSGLGTPRMTVPEASVHLYDTVPSGKDDVRRPRKTSDVLAETEAASMKGPPEAKLGASVRAAYSRHHP